MVEKTKCPECRRSFQDVAKHVSRQHPPDTAALAGAGERPLDSGTATGHVVQTSHNKLNPNAPPPSYTPATTRTQQEEE